MDSDLSQVNSQDAELLTTEDVARLLKIQPATLVDWRHDQRGPRYYRMGRKVRYKLADVRQWQEQSLVPVEPTMV
jgi:excisionase family DNA binding protein